MNQSTAVILAGMIVALAAIGAATAAAILGTIDGASFSAIIGAAIGGISGMSGRIFNGANNSGARR